MNKTSINTTDKHEVAQATMREFTRRIVTKKAVAAYCGVTQRCIDNWRWDRKFPSIKIGRVARFDLAEVDAWLEANRETPAS
jgi:excisionase family DNA binding protein